MEQILIYGGFAVVAIAVIILFVFIVRSQRRTFRQRLLSTKLLLIQLPQRRQEGNFKEDINLFEQLLSVLASGKHSATFEAAVHHAGEEIHFYIAVPKADVAFVSRQIEGVFNNAHIEEAPEYNIFQPDGFVSGAYIKQEKHFSLPLRTYMEADVDTFSPIINGLSQVGTIGEGAALQVLVRPAPSHFRLRIVSIINDLKKGETFEKLGTKYSLQFKDIQEFFSGTKKQDDEKNPSVVDEDALRTLEKKISKPLVQVNYRIIASAVSQYQADSIVDGVVGSLSQFEAPLRNMLSAVSLKNNNKLSFQFSFRQFDEAQSMVLSTEELAGLFHLPSASTLSPKIKWLKSKEAPPPPNLSSAGTLIGESVFRGVIKPVRIADEDRRRHVYVVGQTGTGKSTLLENMAWDDISAGKGIAIIDPHGDLVESVLGLIPENRKEDVIVFDPGYLARPVGLNMLEYDSTRPEEKTFIVNEIQGIFNKLFLAETMGPMFEQYMRNALLLLMDDKAHPSTLVDVPRIFTDEEFRHAKLSVATNPVVIDFWTKEATKVGGEGSLANMTPYITSKFNNFIANDYVRPIIGQAHSSFNFRKIMDEGKILLVNLSKGRIGEMNANLLGMIIVGKLLMAALSRVDIPQEERHDFNLYIDEFQNFTTDSISTILSEARKYRLNLTIAHQYIAQLEDSIREAVFGNVGSVVAFRVGTKDAEFLVKQFEPVFDENDLINIANFNAYVRILIHNQTTNPFTMRTIRHPNPDLVLAQNLRAQSFERFGKDRVVVEQEILARLRG